MPKKADSVSAKSTRNLGRLGDWESWEPGGAATQNLDGFPLLVLSDLAASTKMSYTSLYIYTHREVGLLKKSYVQLSAGLYARSCDPIPKLTIMQQPQRARPRNPDNLDM